MKHKIKMLSVVLLFVFGANFCAAKDSNSTQASGSPKGFPRWITEEKIRAGFVLAKGDVKYAELMRSHGLNTAIVAAERIARIISEM